MASIFQSAGQRSHHLRGAHPGAGIAPEAMDVDVDAPTPAAPRGRAVAKLLSRIFARQADPVDAAEPGGADDRLLDGAGGSCRAALAFLAEHGLQPTPDHYQLAWTCTVSPTSSLSVAVDELVRQHGRLTRDRVAMLLSEQRAGSVAHDLAELLATAQQSIADGDLVVSRSHDDVAAFGDALRSGLVASAAGAPSSTLATGMISLAETLIRQMSDTQTQLRDVSGQLSAAQQRAAAAERLANIDPLTGLANRRAFDRILDGAIAEARTSDRPLAIAFCDIDRFKALNDSHGHATGDRVLRYVAKLLDALSDENCHVARHGGEEFVLLFRGRSAVEALPIVDGVRETLANRNLRAFDTRRSIGRVTFSSGLATLQPGDGAIDVLNSADLALYRAKSEGRNRVSL